MFRTDFQILRKPGKYAVVYMLIVLGVFLLGPISYFKSFDFYAFLTIFLLFAYIFALKLGYKRGNEIIHYESYRYYQECRTRNENVAYRILKYTVISNAIIVTLNAFEYASASSLSGLFNNAVNGLMNPSDAYYHKDVSSRAGSVLSYITMIYNPILYMTQVYSLVIFKKFKFPVKIIIIATLVIEVMRWLAIGTNKGLLDIILLLFSVYLINNWSKKFFRETTKGSRRTLVVIIAAVVVFLFFFASAMSARVNGEFSENLFTKFPYNLVPVKMQLFVEKFDSYLTQGYGNYYLCLSECHWEPTWGIGNSRFLMDVLKSISGIDLFPSTYPAQLQQNSNIDALAAWHSAFGWLASDFTPVGIIILLYFFGIFCAKIVYEAIAKKDMIACTLLYFIVLAIVNSSCTNYVFAYSSTFIGFWGLCIIRLLRRGKCRLG